MRNPEEMAYALYLADYNATDLQRGQPSVTWDELSKFEQQIYLRHTYAAFNYLFEHGRISAYVSHVWLDQYKREYAAYLAENEAKR